MVRPLVCLQPKDRMTHLFFGGGHSDDDDILLQRYGYW